MKKQVRKKRGLSLIALLLTLLSFQAYAQNVTVSGASTGNGSYPDLASAFAAINGGSQTGANINVQIVASTTETTTAVLNAGSWATMSVVPSGGSYNVGGNIAGPLISFNGATNVWMNGLNSGGNALAITNSNTASGAVSILFINSAADNTLTNLSVFGAGSSTGYGVITFSTASIAPGNSGNLISNSNVGPVGTTYPVNSIYSAGSIGFENRTNTISNCNIYDFFNASLATSGVNILSNSIGWTITGNRFYQTAARTYTTGNTHKAIVVSSGGNAFTVTNNVIGYSAAALTGTYVMGGTIATRFIGIELSVGTLTTSSIQGNTVSAITLSTSSGAATTNGIICGINVLGGNVNVGTSAGNIIGGTLGTNLINGYPTTTQGMIVGINSSSTNTVTISNNYIGGFFSSGSTAAVAGGVSGINISEATALLSITNNTIGNPTTNNMRAGTLGLTTGNSLFYGIFLSSSPTGTPIISNNIIRNGASYGIGTTGVCRGIYTGSTGGSGTYSVTNNTILNLTTDNGNTAQGNGQLGNVGIAITNGVANVISGNTIGNLANTNTLTTAVNQGGISTAVSSNPIISNNIIYGLSNTGASTSTTAPSQVYGIFVRGGSGTLTVNNNMISLGAGQTANTAFSGVVIYGGGGTIGTRMYYNTINITGTVASGAQSSFCFYRGGYNGFATTWPVDIRNNIFTNTRTGGTGFHCAIANNYASTSNTTGWGANASNYNILNASTGTSVAWYNGPVSLTTWQSTLLCDGASYTGASVTYSNAATGDLHINMGTTPNFMESGGTVIAGFTTDIDGQSRPGPAGSLNGGGVFPDMGADEFDGVVLDVTAPLITNGNFTGSGCSTTSGLYTVNIADVSGVATGSLAPRLYYKLNAGAYTSVPGSLSSGTLTNGVWSFTPTFAGALGDIVSYFVVAQDAYTAAPNIAASPSAGFGATSVNNVTATPTTPNTFMVAGSMAGTYSVGAGQTFTVLTAAAMAYNNACLTGPVTLMLTDATYTAETFPITFQNNTTASASNSLLVRPAAGASPTITGSFSTAIIKVSGGDYITFDGSNNATTSQDLTIENTSTLATAVMFWLGNSSLTDAASNITIKNSVLTGSTGVNTVAGIIMGSGITFGGASDIANNNITVANNQFKRVQQAVFASGNAAVPDANWSFVGNSCGSATTADKLGFRGLLIQNAQNVVISSNTISGVSNTVASNTGMGISVGSNASNYTITNNVIYDLKNTNATSAAGFLGMRLTSTSNTANILVANNMISDIATYGSLTAGVTTNGYGIAILSGGGYKLYHNSIVLNTNQTVSGVQAPLFISSGVTAPGAIDLRNNIIANTQTVGTERYAIYSQQTSNTIFSNIDNNAYSTTGPNLGFIVSNRSNLAAIQTGFGGNVNSTTVAPVFTASNDLHLVPASNAALDGLGTPLSASVATDIDGQTRSTTTPDMGADEFVGPGCASVNAGTLSITSYSGCSGSAFTLATTGASSGSGINLQWKVSTTPGGPYTDVTVGNGINLPTYASAPLGFANYYYVLTATCTTASLTAVSNEATVTVLQTPTAGASVASSSVCVGSNINLIGSTDVGASFAWTGPNTFTSSSQNPTITSVAPGASGVYSFYSSLGTCNSPTTMVAVTVMGGVNVLSPASISSSVICSGSTAQLSVSAAPTNTAINLYTFSYANTASLVSTTSGTNVLLPNNDDTPMATATNIGFNFMFNGVTYSQFSASPDGWILLGNGVASAQFGNLVNSTTNVPKIYPYWDDVATGTTGYVRTFLTGTAPFRIMVIEWFVTIPRNLSGPANSTFQLLLYETTNAIEFRYGAMNASPMSASSGLTASGTLYNCITFNTNSNSSTVINDNNGGQPPLGTSYMFSPGRLNYQWSPGTALSSSTLASVTSSATVSSIYTLTIDNNGFCPTTSTLSLNVENNPTVSVLNTGTLLCNGVSATLTAFGANSYTWNTGATSTSIVVTPATSTVYAVVGENAPCIATSTQSVNIDAGTTPTLNVAGTPSICSGGTASITASGATTYSWSNSITSAAFTVSPVAGNYVYTVTGYDPVGCSSSLTQSLDVYATPTLNITGTSSICVGQTVGLNVSGSGTYSWNTGSTSSGITGSPTVTTTYSVVGTSTAGCSASALRTVTVNANPVLNVLGSTGICTGQNATLTVSGANTYSWNTGSTTNSIVTTPVSNTTYTVTGVDLLGCSSTTTQLVTVAASLTITIAGPSTVCSGQPITLTGNGGVTYTWNTGATTQTISVSPTVTTTYSLIGASGTCSNSGAGTLSVNPNPVVGYSGNMTICSGQTTTLTGSGASTYNWSSGATSSTAALSPTITTTYTLTGTNGFGCSTNTLLTVVSNPTPLVFVTQSAGTVCANSVASFTANGAVTYTWSNSATSAITTYTPASASIYTVSGTNGFGCIGTRTVAVGTFSLPILSITPPSATVCVLSPANFTASGASTYTWNGSVTTTTAAFTPTANSVYTLSGTNSSGCVSTTTLGVSTNSLPILNITPPSATVCAFSTATFNAAGATTYTWSGNITSPTVAYTPSVNSTYTLTGASSDGCRSTATVGVATNTLPVIVTTPASGSVCAQSPFTFTASGANTYTWSTASTTSVTSITPTASAVYTVSGTNAAGCVASRTLALGAYPLPTLAISPASPTVCLSSPVTFTATGANTYSWNNTTPGATITFTPTAPTVYTLTGFSSFSCASTTTVAAATFSLPVVSISPSSATVCAFSGATFAASGASTYVWNNTTPGSTITLFQGNSTTYSVTGTSSDGCLGTATVAVSTNPLPTVTAVPQVTTVCESSSVTLSVGGALTYSWGTGSTGTTAVVTPTTTTSYTVIGTDANGCSSVGQAVVITNVLPTLSITASSATVCATSPVTVTASGANTYSWNTGAGSAATVVNPAVNTVYSVVGTETVNGCSSTKTIAISTLSLPIVNVALSSTAVCDGSSATLTASGANSYVWDNTATTPVIIVTPLNATTYTVTGTDNVGCSSSKTVQVGVNPLPNIAVTPSTQLICVDEVTSFSATGGTSYNWIPGNSSGAILTVTATVQGVNFYTVEGTDANNCKNVATFVLSVNQCVGIADNQANSHLVTVYPNPSAGEITARFDFEGRKNILIVDVTGRVVEMRVSENRTEEFDLSRYAKGVYYVRVVSKTASANFKISVQ